MAHTGAGAGIEGIKDRTQYLSLSRVAHMLTSNHLRARAEGTNTLVKQAPLGTRIPHRTDTEGDNSPRENSLKIADWSVRTYTG